MVGVTGEPAGDRRCPAGAGWIGVFSVPRSSIRPISPTLTASASSARRAGGVDPVGAPLLDEPEQGVDLAHLGPRQRDVEQRRRVGADRRAVAGGEPLEVVEVTHRVDGRVPRQVVRVGRAAPGLLAGMDLDQLAPVEDPHQLPVGAHLDAGADQVARDRVERLGDLDVMIPMHLRRRVDRHVVDARSVPATAAAAPRAANTSTGRHWVVPWIRMPGPLPAPRLGAALRVGEIDERLTGAERVPHELHRPLDPRLVLRATHPGRVDQEPAGLGVLDERLVQPRLERIGVVDDRRHVVGDHRARTPRRRTPTPLRTRRSRRRWSGGNDNHTKQCREKHGREDQRLHHPPPARPDRRADPSDRSRPATRRPARRRRPAPSGPARGGGRTPRRT